MPETRTDYLGQEISIGDYVVYTVGNFMRVGQVTKFNPKMLTIGRVPKDKWKTRNDNQYPRACVKVPAETVTMAVLMNAIQP